MKERNLEVLESNALKAIEEMASALGNTVKPNARIIVKKSGRVVELNNCEVFTPKNFQMWVRLDSDDGQGMEITADDDTENAGAFVLHHQAGESWGKIFSGVAINRTQKGWVMEDERIKIEIDL
ncbi:hypothetical protein PSE10A_19150 [Pseudomonas amygdali pv. eriobotryae]|uniref:Uncharacterized protein n=1 Tax=Pseudomonas amygdali pv. eriobotryae TaxID=129137 RepID=A0A9P3EBW8_PSEA0|nr:hypothetical protein [Pseudomonas amygdali]GFZ59404.1 hypothetical protein PSE10A_19150 [Pseudomonas amygdali pv. eriobotryae]